MNPMKLIACPWCKAEEGQSCRNPDGSLFKAGIHMARYYALQEAKQAS